MMVYILSAICLIFYVFFELRYYLRGLYILRNYKGPKSSSFILGNWDVVEQPPEIIYRKIKKLGEDFYPHCSMRFMYLPAILIVSPEDFEIFMTSTTHTTKGIIYEVFKLWLRDGLLVSSGEKWHHRRKIITPAFHFSILKDFLCVFNERSSDFVKRLASKVNEEIDVVPELQEFALTTINETAMGLKGMKDDSKLESYRMAIADMETCINHFMGRPWLTNIMFAVLNPFYWKAKRTAEVLHDYTESKIKEKKEILATHIQTPTKVSEYVDDDDSSIYLTKKKKRMAMLDILFEAQRNGNQIDNEGICEEVDTFTFEGHDTVSSALSYCFFTIANHPEIQEQIVQEVNSILTEENQQPTYDDLQKMELLERCIKETLRLYPSVHIISRFLEEDAKLHSGWIAPKHTMLLFSILVLHRNPNIYPDPDKFDPNRFLPENCLHRHPFAYLPFSAGPRNCIGQRFAMIEMKALLSVVVRKFRIIPVDKHLELKMEAILRPKNGIKVKFIPRNT